MLLLPWVTASAASQLLLVPSTELASAPPCASYAGALTHQALHVFRLPPGCSQSLPASPRTATSKARLLTVPVSDHKDEPGFLMHAIPSALDYTVPELAYRKQSLLDASSTSQHAFSVASDPKAPHLVASLPDAHSLLYFPTTDSLSHFTSDPANSFVELVSISSHPLPLPSLTYPAPLPVPEEQVARITSHLKKLRYNPLLHGLLSSLPGTKSFERDVRYLTGEDQTSARSGSERWVSRHSMSEGGHKASAYLLAQFKAMGGLDCKQHVFQNGFAPLVACVVVSSGKGKPKDKSAVVLGAHFDSRGSFGYLSAPGGDDDGSGTSLLLAVARQITTHRLTFARRLIIVAFAGEEQGLLGSQWYAKYLKEQDTDVALMLQVDMIGYRKPGEPMQLAFPPDSLGLREARWLVGNISTIYVPELQVGFTPACCSDHQSFTAQGYASTWVFERNGPIADPTYHSSQDVSDRTGYDFDQIYAVAQVVLATVLEVAGFAFR